MSLSFETDSVEVGFGISASPVISAEWGEIGGDIEEQGDLQAALGGKLSDAPKDGKTYGRKGGAWSEVTGGGGAAWGGITGTLGDQTDLQTALDAKGTYSKPSGGIPKADLASGVQDSLDLADSALQEHQSLAAYRTAAQQDAIHDSTKQDSIADLADIRSGAALGATAIQSHQDISGKEDASNKVTSISAQSTDSQYPSAKCVHDIVGNVESLLEGVL